VRLFQSSYPTEKSEAEGIARRISALIGGASFFALDSKDGNAAGWEDSADPEDCAILLRTAALAPPIIKALGDHGIPFEFVGDKPWWEEEPAKSLVAFLRGPRAADLRKEGITSAEAVRSGWDALCRSGKIPRSKQKKEGEFLKRLCGMAAFYEDLPAFLDTLAVSGGEGAPELRRRGVRIMTIHAAKGLEFDHVFVAALEEGLLPFTLYDKAERIEEEKRLLYVAMTRARSGLYLSWARSRIFQNRKLTGAPSRFLGELETLVPLAPAERPLKRDPQMRLF
jgi:superfamily I DNA/RNA helicase